MNLITSSVQTMSSREIAKLVESRHDSVKRTIERLYTAGAISYPPLVDGKKAANGVTPTHYEIGKRDSYVIVAQLSPTFTARLVDRWQELEQKEQQRALAAQSRQTARLEAPLMTDAVKDAHEEPKHFHYSNEFNLINKLVLGVTAKQYRTEHGMSKADAIRDHLTPCEIEAIEHLQRANTTMIEIGLDFNERKNKLAKLLVEKHSRKLLNEFARLEY